MKVDNYKIPNGFSKTRSCKAQEEQENFSQVLSKTINYEDKKTDKEQGENIPLLKSMGEIENDIYIENPFVLAFDLIPYRVEELNLSSSKINIEGLDSYLINEVATFEKELLINNDLSINEENPIISKDNLEIDRDSFISVTKDISVSKDLVLNNDLNIDKEPTIIYKDFINKEEKVNQELPYAKEIIEFKVDDLSSQIRGETIENIEEDDLTFKKEHKDFISNPWVNNDVVKFQDHNTISKPSIMEDFILSENIERINDSIIKLMETSNNGNSSVMKVELYPKELGNINVTLTMEEGKLIAKITVDNEGVKEMLTKSIDKLNSNLIKQDITIEKVQIDLNYSSNSNSNWNFNQSNRNFFKRHETLSFKKETIDDVLEVENNFKTGEISILA